METLRGRWRRSTKTERVLNGLLIALLWYSGSFPVVRSHLPEPVVQAYDGVNHIAGQGMQGMNPLLIKGLEFMQKYVESSGSGHFAQGVSNRAKDTSSQSTDSTKDRTDPDTCLNTVTVVDGAESAGYTINTTVVNQVLCDNGISDIDLHINWGFQHPSVLAVPIGQSDAKIVNGKKIASMELDCRPDVVSMYKTDIRTKKLTGLSDKETCATTIVHELGHDIDSFSEEGPLDASQQDIIYSMMDNRYGPGTSGPVEDFALDFEEANRERYKDIIE